MHYTSEADSLEKLRLLGELANQDSKAATDYRGGATRRPDWTILENSAQIPRGAARILQQLECKSLKEQCEELCQDQNSMLSVLSVFQRPKKIDEEALLYTIEWIIDLARSNTWIWDAMRTFCQEDDPVAIFYTCYTAYESQHRLAGLLAAATASALCHGGQVTPQTEPLIQSILEGVRSRKLSPLAAVYSLDNILKLDASRPLMARNDTFCRLIRKCLQQNEDSNLSYAGVFAVWQLSCNSEAASLLRDKLIIEALCDALHSTKREKVVRVACYAFSNFSNLDWAIEVFGANKTTHTLALLEYEKWRDEDLYTELRELINKMNKKLSELSNFERYKRELDSGALHWSPLHTEKFWTENFTNFEVNEFKTVKTLQGLLTSSSDSTTLAVACFDLGEFARLHPTGKQILGRLKTKETVMQLMSHPNRDVSREALLCVQKLMLGDWRKVGAEAQEKHTLPQTGLTAR